MRFLRFLPAVLACWVLAAHFLRSGRMALVAFCVALPVLLILRRWWAVRLVQAALLLGAIEWVRSLVAFVRVRQALGQPWGRLVAILAGVALFTLLAAVLLPRPRRRATGTMAPRPPEPTG